LLIVQTPLAPAAVRNAVVDLLDAKTSEIRIASAYVTLQGSKILFGCLSKFLDHKQIDAIPKLLVTSLDFGLTEPAALSLWSGLPNATVRVAGAKSVAKGSLLPTQAYHPKVYAFGLLRRANLLVGSANMTSRGLTINSEAMWAQKNIALSSLDKIFSSLTTGTEPLTNNLLIDYQALQKKKPPPKALKGEIQNVPPPTPVAAGGLLPFREAVESGTVNPADYREFWVQVEGLQGGSGNQLELPRQGHRFFGFNFKDYSFPDKKTIGVVTLRAGASRWSDRLLTWHGNNKMERINLPTKAQGGFQYNDSAIMFRRLPDGSFELVTESWESDLARSWRSASAASGLLFRLRSAANSRLVGLIP
jgi:HKD family nuclease